MCVHEHIGVRIDRYIKYTTCFVQCLRESGGNDDFIEHVLLCY